MFAVFLPYLESISFPLFSNMQSVPNIPGIPVRDDRALKEKVAQLLDMKKYKWVRSHTIK